MLKHNTFAVGLIACIVTMPVASAAQDAGQSALQSSVVSAVARSLGADPGNLPNYVEELKQARIEADRKAVCGSSPVPQFLTALTAEKVFNHVTQVLADEGILIAERPRYFADLIAISAASFEAGRLAATSIEYRQDVCAR